MKHVAINYPENFVKFYNWYFKVILKTKASNFINCKVFY